MKKFDKAVAVDAIKELANEICADYVTYFDDNNIDEEAEKENQLVKSYWIVADIELERSYKCDSEEEFERLKSQLIKARNLLNESK